MEEDVRLPGGVRDARRGREFGHGLRGALVFAALTANTIACCLPLFVLALIRLAIRNPRYRRSLSRGLASIAEAMRSR